MPLSRKLHVHLAQMNSVDDVVTNFEAIKSCIRTLPVFHPRDDEAAHQLLCFPENCLFLRLKEGAAIESFDLTEKLWTELGRLALEKNVVLHLGSVALRQGTMTTTNSSVTVTPDGQVLSTYSKIHLFDIELEGQKPVRESDVFAYGSKDELLQVGDWVLGQSICYDVRFSELYRRYAEAAVDVILVPSSFLVQTGQAHWEILLRARAIESQAYVLAAAQAGRHSRNDSGAEGKETGGERFTYGHSLIVEPWGQVLADAGPTAVTTISAILERENLEKVRRQIPMKNHRRLR